MMRFDKVIARTKRCNFFASQCSSCTMLCIMLSAKQQEN